MHLLNAYAITGQEPPQLEWLVESHAEYPAIRSRMEKGRKLAKAWCHGTNYGGSPRTMAVAAGITIRESEMAQKRYFGLYPGILDAQADGNSAPIQAVRHQCVRLSPVLLRPD